MHRVVFFGILKLSFSSNYYEVNLGMLRRSSYSPLTQTRPVVNVFIHPKFDINVVNDDLALLSVQIPFDLNQWTAPICLPPANYLPAIDTNCTTIGWGLTNGTVWQSKCIFWSSATVSLLLYSCHYKVVISFSGCPPRSRRSNYSLHTKEIE